MKAGQQKHRRIVELIAAANRGRGGGGDWPVQSIPTVGVKPNGDAEIKGAGLFSAHFVQWVEEILYIYIYNMIINDFVFIAPFIIILSKVTDFYE